MKLTALFLTLAIVHVSARSMGQRVTLTKKQISVSASLREIHKQTGYTIFWSETSLEKTKPIDVDLKDVSLRDALDKILSGLPYTYEMEGRNIVIIPRSGVSASGGVQGVFALETIRGRVTDSAGHPLQNVSVLDENRGRANGYTLTDANGEFRLLAQKGDRIVFSYVGYKTQAVVVGEAGPLNVVMRLSEHELDKVTINTGYQTLSRERSAGAFYNPDIKSFSVANSGGASLISRLDGLVPGLVINNSPTQPGITIRGITSINAGTSPLYVVDGLPANNINDINYNDVESITVLKDATAASIWGARAANGVIVITTRRAHGNQLQVDYDVNYSFQQKPDFGYLRLMDSRQYIQAMQEIYTPAFWAGNTPLDNTPGLTAVPPHYQILRNEYLGKISSAQASASLDSLAGIDNTHQIRSLFYRAPVLGNHTLSVAGGGGLYSLRASFSFTDNLDNTPADHNHNYNLLLRNDFNFSKRVQVYLIAQVKDNESSGKRYSSVRPATDLSVVPYALYRNKGQNLNLSWLHFSDSIAANYQALSGIGTAYIPLDEANNGYTDSTSLNTRVNAGITIRLIDGLRFEGVYGMEKDNGQSTSFDDADSWTVRSLQLAATSRPATAGGAPTHYLPMTGGLYKTYNSKTTNWTVRNQLVYDKNFFGKHQLTLLLGQEAQKNLSDLYTLTEYGYDPQLLTYTPINYASLSTTVVTNPVETVNSGIKIIPHNYTVAESDYRFVSYYANGAYTFDRKYTVNGSWRNDQSSLFGEDRSAQRRPVWSAGAAWLLSDEKWMDPLQWLNRLSIRATYGITGNAPSPGSAASFDILTATSSAIFPNGGLTISTPANRALTWEETKTANLGLDFSVLQDRLSGSIDLYEKKTSNLIGLLPLDPFTGYATITGNYGDMENKGVELGVTSLNVKQRDFSWSTTVNLGYNKNKITKILSSVPYTLGSQMISTSTTYVVGHPAQTIFAYNYAGLDSAGHPQIKLANGSVTGKKNVATPADMINKGSYQPLWEGGLINTFRYKAFTLTANIIFEGGNVMRRDVPSTFSGNVTTNLAGAMANRWKQPGDEKRTNIPGFQQNAVSAASYDFNYYIFAAQNVVSASFAKLRDLSLSYAVPAAWFGRTRIKGISVRAGISNVLLWRANHFGIDPEFLQSRDAGAGANGFNYPVRTLPVGQDMLSVGAHVTF